ncbi:MAG TPA: peptidoglycan-binding domain-containing protein [Pseudonocardiaceae bacterium]
MSRRTLRLAGLTTLAVLSAGAVVAAAVGVGGAEDGASQGTAASGLPPATTTITRRTLVLHTEVDGTLGHGAATVVTARGGGTLTWLPAAGAVVERGGTLYRVDERPVVLLYGSLPAYRALRPGDEGADVRQLEENLAALGRTGFTVDDEYTSATASAVRDWQEDLGLDGTGVVDPAAISYAAGPVRVSALDTAVGGQAGGPVLRTTGTVRAVTVDLPVSDLALAAVGSAVTVTLPSGSTVEGTVSAVGAVATASDSEGPGGGSAEATVEVTVAVADQAALGGLDEAPVHVALRSAERADVLTVPVTALLALREGGYGLEVVTGTGSRIVAVEPGMFADGQVEVSGPDLAEGLTVGVPS